MHTILKSQEAELEGAELNMFVFEVNRLDRIRNEFKRGMGPVGEFGDNWEEDAEDGAGRQVGKKEVRR